MINEEAARRFMTAPWLVEVDHEIKLALLNALAEERAEAGAVLLAQGQPNDHLTFLIEGSVELERTFSTGRKEVVTTLTAPVVFGTTSFFQPKPPTVTARALTDVWMLTLHHPAHRDDERCNRRTTCRADQTAPRACGRPQAPAPPRRAGSPAATCHALDDAM